MAVILAFWGVRQMPEQTWSWRGVQGRGREAISCWLHLCNRNSWVVIVVMSHRQNVYFRHHHALCRCWKDERGRCLDSNKGLLSYTTWNNRTAQQRSPSLLGWCRAFHAAIQFAAVFQGVFFKAVFLSMRDCTCKGMAVFKDSGELCSRLVLNSTCV